MALEDRMKEYQAQVAPEYRRHIVRNLRADYPEIPTDLTDDDVLKAHRTLFGEDLDDSSYSDRLNKAYGSDFEPSVKAPEPNLVEQAQAVLPQVPGIAGEMAKEAAPFVGSQVIGKVVAHGAPSVVSKVEKAGLASRNLIGRKIVEKAGMTPLARAARVLGTGVGQLALAAETGFEMAGEQMAGAKVEETARRMPQPDIASLRSRGYSEAQIANIVRGYAQVQQELFEEERKIGEAGVSTAAQALADAALFGMGAGKIEKVAEKLTSRGVARAGARATAAGIAGKTAGAMAGGATFGAAFSGTHGASERMAKARAAGLGADDIWKSGVAGVGGDIKTGAILGAVITGAIGAPVAVVSTGREAAATASAARRALAEKAVADARAVNLQKFADEFRTTDLRERFWEELKVANEQGLPDAQLAANIVDATQGAGTSQTQEGMRAASMIYERIQTWRQTENALAGPMVDLPKAPEPAIAPVPGMQGPAAGLPGEGGIAPEPHPIEAAPPVGVQQIPPFVPPAEPPKPVRGIEAAVPVAAPPAGLVSQGIEPQAPYPGYGLRGGSQPPQLAVPPLAVEGLVPKPEVAVPEINPKLAGVPPVGEAAAPAVPGGPPAGPGEVKLPTLADDAAKLLAGSRNVEVSPGGDGKFLTIKRLGVPAGELAKPGTSSDAIAQVNAVADEHGLPVEAYLSPAAGPRGGRIPLEKLIPWYEQHGYKVTSQGEGFATVRREPELPAVAERVKDLPREGAQMAAGNVTLGQPMAHSGFGERLLKIAENQAEAARRRIAARGTRLYAMGLDPEAVADHAVILAAEMFSKGMRAKTACANWMIEKWGDVVRPHIDAIYQKASAHLSRMFKDDVASRKRLTQLVALRTSGAHGANWYEKTADWVKTEFGPDSDMMLRFLATTSADAQTEAGVALALKAFAQWKSGLPFEGTRGMYSAKMLSEAVRGGEFGGDKVYSFYRALRGDKDAIVLDRWMIRALGIPTKRGDLREANYKLYAQIVQNLSSDAGMTPRQFQAAVWEGARVGNIHARWKKGGPYAVSKVGSARPFEDLLAREFGGLTPYQWVERNRVKFEDLANMTAGLKATREHGGFTFDPSTWGADRTPGYVVSLISDVVPRKSFYPGALTKFRNHVQRIVSESGFGGPKVTIGTWDMGDTKPGHFSIDLNVTIPATGPDALALAKRVGKENRQFEVGEIGPDGNYVRGHKTGYDPKVDGPQFLPPAKGIERIPWFKGAVARARGLLNEVEKPTVEGRPTAPTKVAKKPAAPSAPKTTGTQKIMLAKLGTLKLRPLPPGGSFYTGHASGAPVWLTPDAKLYAGRSHESVAIALARAAKLTEKKVGYQGMYRWDNHALLQQGFIRLQLFPDRVAVQVVGEPSAAQRTVLLQLAKKRTFEGVVTAFDGSDESQVFDRPARLFLAAEQMATPKGWLKAYANDPPSIVMAKREIQRFFDLGEDQKAVDLAIKMGLLK